MPPRDYYRATRSSRSSGGAPPGERGGGGYVEPKQEKKGLLSKPEKKPEKRVTTGTTEGPVGLGSPPPVIKTKKKKQITEGPPGRNYPVTKGIKHKPTLLSKTRDLATKAGVPVVFSQFGYSLMGGRDQNVPLTIENFNDKEKQYIKNKALSSIVEEFGTLSVKSDGTVASTKPIVVQYYAGNPLDVFNDASLAEKSVGSTLARATVYINNEGELIVTDYYDWQTGINLKNPDTNSSPTTIDEWSYTVGKQVGLYLSGSDEGDYMREMYEGSLDMLAEDVYNISTIFMDAAETLANIIGPKKYKEKSIFDVPEENRMILNLGKVQ